MNRLFDSAKFGQRACADMPPEQADAVFFPKGERAHNYSQAEAFCGRCPVVDACLEYAQEFKIPYGMFGGESPRQRRGEREAIAATKPPRPTAAEAEHGTLTRARRHQRDGETMCALCRLEVNAYNRAGAKRRKLAGVA